MTYYTAKDIAASFRTVRNNTLKIAEEIPEEKYGFRAAEGARTIAQTLIHISNLHRFALILHRDQPDRKTLDGINIMAIIGPILATEQEPMTKAQILDRLRSGADEFESWVKTLREDFLGEVITMPPGGSPPQRTRFDMIIAVKEHEMHHRGQLMLLERMIGITPHLTRAMQERMAAAQAAQKS